MPYTAPPIVAFDEDVVLTFDPAHSQLTANAAMNGIGTTNFAWPAANLAIFVPVYVWEPLALTRFVVPYGTVTGNVDVGIYDANLSKVVSAGSTAASGLVQQFAVTTTTLNRGTYYLALAFDTNTAQCRRVTTTAAYGRMLGQFEQTSAFPLPATATPAAFTRTVMPIFGFTTRSAAL